MHSILRFGEDAIKSVRVLPSDNGVKIYIHVNITPGTKIPKVASEIQKNVKNAVQSMTGKMVSKVNVSIAVLISSPKAKSDFLKPSLAGGLDSVFMPNNADRGRAEF